MPLLAAMLVTATLVAASARARQSAAASREPPGRGDIARIDGDRAILVNGRRATPAGRVLRTQSYAWGLAIAPGGRRAALVHARSIEIVDLVAPFAVRRIPEYGSDERPDLGEGSYMGCAFSLDGTRLYYGSADEGRVVELDIATGTVSRVFDLNGVVAGHRFEDSFAGDLALSRDGRRLFVVDQFNFRFVAIDVASGQVVRSVRVGRHPFAIALSPDERSAWVSNVGMFEYPLVPGVTEDTRGSKGLPFPAYGVPSKEAASGAVSNGVRVPGLGSPNVLEAMSVFGVRVDEGRVTARIKTGYLVGAERDDLTTIGGASPGAVVAGPNRLYVANATNDTISVIDTASGRRLRDIDLTVPGLERLRGVLPFGEALSADGRSLYVACA